MIPRIGFAGLGAMGYHIAGKLSKKFPVLVWNRSRDKAMRHSKEFGTTLVEDIGVMKDVDYVMACMPTADTANELFSHIHSLKCDSNLTFVDLSSGDIDSSQNISKILYPNRYMDAPVSGGPIGAANGTLTSMVGSTEPLTDVDKSVFEAYSKVIVECGNIGHGNAIKAANNFLNVTHLLLASDVLIQLKKAGISPTTALECINSSSGRSLQTEVRIPTQVLSRKFDYGFKLNLMRKDVLQSKPLLQGTLFYKQIEELLQPHALTEADYTSVVRDLERENQTTLS